MESETKNSNGRYLVLSSRQVKVYKQPKTGFYIRNLKNRIV